jgi:hypothetical protein
LGLLVGANDRAPPLPSHINDRHGGWVWLTGPLPDEPPTAAESY